MPLTGPTCTVAILAAALADVNPDSPVVVRIADTEELWRISDVTLAAMRELHKVNEAVVNLPAEYVIVVAHSVIPRELPPATHVTPDEDADVAGAAGGKIRWLRLLRRWTRKRAP
jgi:hypothetical protein